MASPQKENGYTALANELWSALMETPLSDYEHRFLCVLWWKTYGFHKTEDKIPNSQFCKLTGLTRGHIFRTQQKLLKRRIIIRRDVSRLGYKLRFNKNYEEWLDRDCVSSLGLSVSQIGTKVSKIGYGVYPKLEDSKENTKETYQKEIEVSTAQPRKRGLRCPLEKGWDGTGEHPHKECIEYITSKGRFPNFPKQIGQLHHILKAGFSFEEIDDLIAEIEKDRFYRERGWDFATLSNEMGRRRG